MTCSPDHIAIQIREKGFRLTPQRMAILHILFESGGHLAPTEIYEKLQPILAGATEPTVYRTLDFLCEHGFIRATHPGGGHLEYEIASHAHHHLVCKHCGYETEIAHDSLQFFYDQLERETGYRLTESHITFIGLCTHCKGD